MTIKCNLWFWNRLSKLGSNVEIANESKADDDSSDSERSSLDSESEELSYFRASLSSSKKSDPLASLASTSRKTDAEDSDSPTVPNVLVWLLMSWIDCVKAVLETHLTQTQNPPTRIYIIHCFLKLNILYYIYVSYNIVG